MSIFIDQMLGSIDPMIIYVCVFMLAFVAVLSIIKKVIWLGICILVLAAGVYVIAPMAKEYQENFSIYVNDETNALVMVIDGREISIGGEYDDEIGINDIDIERLSSGEYELVIKYNNNEISKFQVPGFMRKPIVNYLNKNSYEYTMLE